MARVLVVEDEVLVALDIAQCLRAQGHQICGTCSTAKDAIATAAKEAPQVVVMDITLAEGSSGISAAATIRDRWDIPVIFLTAHADGASVREASIVNPHSYLVKPFKDIDLIAAVQLALTERIKEVVIAGGKIDRPPFLGFDPAAPSSPGGVQTFLATHPFFKQLEKEDIIQLAGCAQLASYPSGETLYVQGRDVIPPFLVYAGQVDLIGASLNGKELIFGRLLADDIFGLLPIVEARRSPFSVYTARAVTLCLFPTQDFNHILNRYSAHYSALLRSLAHQLHAAHRLARAMAGDDATEKLKAVLLFLVYRFSYREVGSRSTLLQISRQELSQYSGLSFEIVQRSLQRLHEERVIDVDKRNTIEILNLHYLQENYPSEKFNFSE